MPVCCRCNASGRCRNCSRKKSGHSCVNCLPHRWGHCENIPPDDESRQQPDVNQESQKHFDENPANRQLVEAQGSLATSPTSPINAPSTTPPPLPPPSLPETFQSLPAHPPLQTPNFMWGNVDEEAFTIATNNAYGEVVHWRRNVFKVPSVRIGKSFVSELARLFRAYAEGSMVEGIALKAAMTMPVLLQKPHHRSKAKDHVACLERRLTAWTEGDLAGLLQEGRPIQRQLLETQSKTKSNRQTAQSFAKLMKEGRVRAALCLLGKQGKPGPLPLDKVIDHANTPQVTVRDVLMEKHFPGQPMNPSALLAPETPTEKPHQVIFDELNGHLIRATALKTEGAAGPSGIDSLGWRHLCTSFREASLDLCEALAQLGRRICTSYVDPLSLDAFTACRLIALDKNPGVRPGRLTPKCIF